MKSGQLAKERKDIRDQQQRAMTEAIPKDLNKIRDDPTANPAVRTLAAESIRTMANPNNQFNLPDWKANTEQS